MSKQRGCTAGYRVLVAGKGYDKADFDVMKAIADAALVKVEHVPAALAILSGNPQDMVAKATGLPQDKAGKLIASIRASRGRSVLQPAAAPPAPAAKIPLRVPKAAPPINTGPTITGKAAATTKRSRSFAEWASKYGGAPVASRRQ